MDYSNTPVTSLSAGALIRPFLLENEYLAATLRGIFPCVAPEGAQFPYVEYECTAATATELKGRPDVDRINVTFTAYATDYDQATAIAEHIRRTVCRYRPATPLPGLNFNGASVVTHRDGWAGDCYYQQLTLCIKLIGTN